MKSNIHFVILCLVVLFCSCSKNTVAQKNDQANQTNRSQNVTDNKNSSPTVPTKTSDAPANAKSTENNISKWKTYTDRKNDFSFRYPSNLRLQKKGNKIRLYHFIKYKHRDPCDMSDNPPMLENLTDFDVNFEIVNKNFDSKDFDADGMEAPFDLPKLSRTIEGKSKWYNNEGCGMYEYFYPLKDGKVLVLQEQIIGFFNLAANPEAETNAALKDPNLIKNDDLIIGEILSSFKYSK